jgi:UDPglucose--hexose-1-phosphate uridylyltransferase
MAKFINEVRKDVLGRKSVIAADRAKRPHDNAGPSRAEKTTPAEECFFCPGNEHLTPPEIDRIVKDGKWLVRVFPNKFPAFSAQSKKAYGRHEVIVETPNHALTLSELSEENLFSYLSMVKRRMEDAQKDGRLAYTIVFKNEGKAAGASLEHSHTQLVSMEFVPEYVKKLAKKSKKLAGMAGKAGKLSYAKNGDFVAFCPKASRFHFETCILPLFEANTLVSLDDGKLRSLSSILKSALVATDAAKGFAPYNILFHSAPHAGGQFLFHIQILPRVSLWAGFELGTEVVMLSAVPEDCAKVFRAKLAELNDKNAVS